LQSGQTNISVDYILMDQLLSIEW